MDNKAIDEMQVMEDLEFDKPLLFKFESEGDFIIGTISEPMRLEKGQSWDSWKITLADTRHNREGENTGIRRVGCTTVIKSRIEEVDIRVGDRIGIKLKANEGSKKYKDFLVVVLRRAVPPGAKVVQVDAATGTNGADGPDTIVEADDDISF